MSAYDLAIATRNALDRARRSRSGPRCTQYSFVDPAGRAAPPRQPQQDAAGRRRRLPRRDRLQDRLHRTRPQHTLVAVATRNGRTLIAVILGVPDSGLRGGRVAARRRVRDAARRAGHGRDAARRSRSRCAPTAPPTRPRSPSSATARQRPRARRPSVTVPAVDPGARLRPRSRAADERAHRGDDAGERTPLGRAAAPAQPRDRVDPRARRSSSSFRRRAVKRQRALRLARRRQRISAMRSGGLPVVDGRYRAGHAHRAAGRVARARPAGAPRRPRRGCRPSRYQGIETPPLGRSI